MSSFQKTTVLKNRQAPVAAGRDSHAPSPFVPPVNVDVLTEKRPPFKEKPVDDPLELFVNSVAERLHGGYGRINAAQLICERLNRPIPKTDRDALMVLNEFLHQLLNWGAEEAPGLERYDLAARLLWTPNMFTAKPWATRAVWNAVGGSSKVLLQGAGSMSKTYSAAVWLLLDWIRDPAYTSVKVVAPKKQHLEQNVFSGLVRLYTESAIPLPGVVGSLFIGLNRRNLTGAIIGAVVPRGRSGVVFQGFKAASRPTPHPVFGRLGRLRILIDEFEDVPALIHSDISNVLGVPAASLKIIGAYNPKHINGPVAALAEPEIGWDSVNPDTDFQWVSRRGWNVVRLDGHRSENVIEGRTVYAGLQTRDELNEIRISAGGETSPRYQTFGRGMYPSSAVSSSCVPQAWLNASVGAVTWSGEVEKYLGIDLALGQDEAVAVEIHVAEVKVRRWQGWQFNSGLSHVFANNGAKRMFVAGVHKLRHGDTLEVAKQCQELAIRLGISPGNMMFDSGNNGQGVVDVLRSLRETRSGMSFKKAQSVLGQSVCSEIKIFSEDKSNARDTGYRIVANEMWGAVRRYFEHGFIIISADLPDDDRRKIFEEFSSRIWTDPEQRTLESKEYFIKRLGRSPDRADALALAVLAIRRIGKFIPTMSDSFRDCPTGNPDPDSIANRLKQDEEEKFEVRIDPSNMSDSL